MTCNFFHFVFLLLISLLLLFPPALRAQPGSVEQSEIDRQRQFLEANQAKTLGDFEKAIRIYEGFLETNPDNAAAAYELARVYEATEDMDNALRFALQAAERDPDNQWYRTFLAQIYEHTEQPLNAAEVYSDLRREYPGNDYFLFMEAYYRVLGQEPEAAIRIYDELEKRVGVVPEVSYKKQRLYLGMGEEKMAAGELRKLAEAYPLELTYWHELAEFYVQFDQREQALQVYREILDKDPDDPKARLALKGGPDVPREGSREEKLEAIFADPDVPIDLKVAQIMPLVNQAVDSGDSSRAGDLLPLSGSILKAHPQEAKAHALQGDLLYHAGRPAEAEEAYRKALSYDKSVYPVWEQLMLILLQKQDYAGLRDISNETLDLFPNQALSYYLNGLAMLELEAYREAVVSLQQAVIMSSRNPGLQVDILNRLGEAQFKMGKPDRGKVQFEKALEIVPEAVPILANFAYQLAAAGQTGEARKILERAREIAPAHPGVSASAGMIAFQEENLPEAQAFFEQSLKQGAGADVEILEKLGDISLMLEQEEKALQYWEKARKLGGNPERLQKKISTRSINH